MKTAGESRKALEARLESRANDERPDLQRLRRQVAFDRLLARLFPKRSEVKYPWILKGGYAIELRIPRHGRRRASTEIKCGRFFRNLHRSSSRSILNF